MTESESSGQTACLVRGRKSAGGSGRFAVGRISRENDRVDWSWVGGRAMIDRRSRRGMPGLAGSGRRRTELYLSTGRTEQDRIEESSVQFKS